MLYLLHTLKRLARFLLTWRNSLTGFFVAFGFISFKIGFRKLSLVLLNNAVSASKNTKSKKAFSFSQQCQFILEHTYTQVYGMPRVNDPLLRSHIQYIDEIQSRHQAGVFEAKFTHLGLRLDGFVKPNITKEKYVELWLNDQCVRTLPLHRKRFTPPFFHFQIKREVLSRFPNTSSLCIKTVEGHNLSVNGFESLELTLPHADGTIINFLKAGGRIDKKGFLALTPDVIHQRQMRYLMIYTEARQYFNHTFGSPLFLMYGTLLGLVREGDFIQGDDDFDCGYISHKQSANEVKQETMQLVVDLVLAGFTCSFNRNGRLFRLRLKDDKPDVHLDVRPVWYEDEHFWAHKQARLPLNLSDFNPVRTEKIRGVDVDIPHHSESFLAAYYGEGWKVPDPTYSNASQKTPRFVKRKLNSVCITPVDYHAMQAQIERKRADHPGAGQLIATGLYPLYPLEEYEANCEW